MRRALQRWKGRAGNERDVEGERVALQLDTCNLLGLVTYALHTQSPVSRRNVLVLKLATNNIPTSPQTTKLGSLQF